MPLPRRGFKSYQKLKSHDSFTKQQILKAVNYPAHYPRQQKQSKSLGAPPNLNSIHNLIQTKKIKYFTLQIHKICFFNNPVNEFFLRHTTIKPNAVIVVKINPSFISCSFSMPYIFSLKLLSQLNGQEIQRRNWTLYLHHQMVELNALNSYRF